MVDLEEIIELEIYNSEFIIHTSCGRIQEVEDICSYEDPEAN